MQQYSLEYYQSKKNYKEWKQIGEKEFLKYFPTLTGNWKEDKSNWRWIMYDRYNDKPNETLKKAAKKYKKSILKEYYNVDDMKDWWDLDLTEIDKSDPIVESVIEEFRERSSKGIKKYGTTLKENNTDDFLQHLKEELMDAVCYIKKLQAKQNEGQNKQEEN